MNVFAWFVSASNMDNLDNGPMDIFQEETVNFKSCQQEQVFQL